jgi:hypothetical protein
VRGADDEDNQMTAARKVTRKQKDIDEDAKKTGKRKGTPRVSNAIHG